MEKAKVVLWKNEIDRMMWELWTIAADGHRDLWAVVHEDFLGAIGLDTDIGHDEYYISIEEQG